MTSEGGAVTTPATDVLDAMLPLPLGHAAPTDSVSAEWASPLSPETSRWTSPSIWKQEIETV